MRRSTSIGGIDSRIPDPRSRRWRVESVAAAEFHAFREREAKKISGDAMAWSERLRLPNWRPNEMSD